MNRNNAYLYRNFSLSRLIQINIKPVMIVSFYNLSFVFPYCMRQQVLKHLTPHHFVGLDFIDMVYLLYAGCMVHPLSPL